MVIASCLGIVTEPVFLAVCVASCSAFDEVAVSMSGVASFMEDLGFYFWIGAVCSES